MFAAVPVSPCINAAERSCHYLWFLSVCCAWVQAAVMRYDTAGRFCYRPRHDPADNALSLSVTLLLFRHRAVTSANSRVNRAVLEQSKHEHSNRWRGRRALRGGVNKPRSEGGKNEGKELRGWTYRFITGHSGSSYACLHYVQDCPKISSHPTFMLYSL